MKINKYLLSFAVVSISYIALFLLFHKTLFTPSRAYLYFLWIINTLNSHIQIFPSRIVLFFQEPKTIAYLDFIPKTFGIVFFQISLLFLHQRKKIHEKEFIFFARSPLILVEIVLRATTDSWSILWMPFLLFLLLIRYIVIKRSFGQYIVLSLLSFFLLFHPFLIEHLSLFLYSFPIFSFVSVRSIETLPYYAVVIFSILFIKKNWKKKEGKIFIIIFFFFIFLSCLFHPAVTLNGTVWRAQWIWSKNRVNDQYVLFEKSFFLPFAPSQSKLNITAKSSYKVYVNGNFVGDGPGPIDEHQRFFDRYSLDSYLVSGTNTVQIIAHNYDHDTHFQKQQEGGVLAEVFVHLGPIPWTFPSDKTWKYTDDTGWKTIDIKKVNIKKEEINSGIYREFYDFSPKAPHALSLESPIKKEDNVITRTIPSLIHQNIFPIKKQDIDGKIIFDYRHVIAGYPTINVTTDAPAILHIQYLEDIPSTLVQEDWIEFPRKGTYSHTTYGRRGFRYAKLEWTIGKGIISEFQTESVSFPAKKIGGITTTPLMYQSMYQLGEDTLHFALQDQMEDSFVHERSQYLGDAYIDMLSGFYSLDGSLLAKKALYQFASTQDKYGLIETVYPSSLHQSILTYNLLFPLFLKDYFFYTNDTQTLNDLIPVAEKILDAFSKLKGKNGLIDIQYLPQEYQTRTLTYWVDHTGTNDKQDPNLNLLLNALYSMGLGSIDFLHHMNGNEKTSEFTHIHEEFQTKLQQFVTTIPIDSFEPRSSIFLLLSDTLDKKTQKTLYENVLKNRPPFTTGYFNLFFLLVMEKMRDWKNIQNLLTEFWGGMIQRGAVTTWETYDPFAEKIYSVSKTHAWASGPTYFIPAYVAGIQPLLPGYRKILIRPSPLLENTETTLHTVCGDIHLTWYMSPLKFQMNLIKTCSGSVRIELPFPQEKFSQIFLNETRIHPSYENDYMVVETTQNIFTLILSK